MSGRKNAIFLDKDGTIVKDVPYNIDKNKIIFVPDLFLSLRILHQYGYQFVIVSNQPGVAKGFYKAGDVDDNGIYLNKKFSENGITISGFYYCSHDHDSNCLCRKPKPGLLFQAASDLFINLKDSWMIGDILDDVEAGNRAGCRTILIDNGNETKWRKSPFRVPDFCADSLLTASRYIEQFYLQGKKQ